MSRKGGTVYQRKDGMWVAAVELGVIDGKRKRKVITSKDRAVVEDKLRELTGGILRTVTISRAELMRAAKAKATHTPTEWHAKVRNSPKVCRYCETGLNPFNMVKDHMIAVERGGSDGIDNVQPICWECNGEKRTTPHDEFVYKGEKPRPFRVLPVRRPEYERVMAKRAEREEQARRKAAS